MTPGWPRAIGAGAFGGMRARKPTVFGCNCRRDIAETVKLPETTGGPPPLAWLRVSPARLTPRP